MPPKQRALNENQLKSNEAFIKKSLTTRELTFLNRLPKTSRDILLRQILNRIVHNLGENAGIFFTRLARYTNLKYEDARPYEENEIGILERELEDVYRGVGSEAIGDIEEYRFNEYYDNSVPHVKPISSNEWKLHRTQKEPAIAKVIKHPWNDRITIGHRFNGVVNQENPFTRHQVRQAPSNPVSLNNRPGSNNEEYIQHPEMYEELDPRDFGRIRDIYEEDYQRIPTIKERPEIERQRRERLRREFEKRLREKEERNQMSKEDKSGSGRIISKQNKWINFVKKIQKTHKITYKNALKLASKLYK